MKVVYSNKLYSRMNFEHKRNFDWAVGSEDALQEAIISAYRVNTPKEDWFRVFHVANGGKRNALEAVKFKRMGVVAGVSDLVCLLPEGKVGFIELKFGKNGLSEKQEAFKDFCSKNGYQWALCRSVGEALDTLRKWGVYSPNLMEKVILKDVEGFSSPSTPKLENKNV